MRPGPKTLAICRAALARGPLEFCQPNRRGGSYWRFGRRRFATHTVKRMIEAGLARREGNKVVSA